MKNVLLLIVVFAAASCMSKKSSQKTVTGHGSITIDITDDPDLFASCIGGFSEQIERVCEIKKDANGGNIWIKPEAPSESLQTLISNTRNNYLLKIVTATRLIENGELTDCQKGCVNKDEKILSCEGQIARFERGRIHLYNRNYEGAFRDFAVILKSGPLHYKNEEVVPIMQRLNEFLPEGLVPACEAAIGN